MKNNISKETIIDGEKSTVVISSNDNMDVNMKGNYTLANNPIKKTNRFIEKYRGTMLGRDIGMKSTGFASTAIFAAIISIAVFIILFISWRV